MSLNRKISILCQNNTVMLKSKKAKSTMSSTLMTSAQITPTRGPNNEAMTMPEQNGLIYKNEASEVLRASSIFRILFFFFEETHPRPVSSPVFFSSFAYYAAASSFRSFPPVHKLLSLSLLHKLPSTDSFRHHGSAQETYRAAPVPRPPARPFSKLVSGLIYPCRSPPLEPSPLQYP